MSLFRTLALGIVVSCLAAAATATPMFYTFAGTVWSSTEASHPVGSSVTYTFLIDLMSPGFYEFSGATFPFVDTPDQDYFFSEYVSGSHVPRPPTTPDRNYELHYGLSQPSFNSGAFGSPTDLAFNFVEVFRNELASTWSVGDTFQGMDRFQDFYGGGTETSEVLSNLTLTSIEAVDAVPEPATLFLFGSGIVGLGLCRRRQSVLRYFQMRQLSVDTLKYDP